MDVDDRLRAASLPRIDWNSNKNRPSDLMLDKTSVSSWVFESPQSSSSWLSHTNRRQLALTSLQSMCNRAVTGCNSKFTVDSFSKLFLKNEVHHILFELFDSQSKGTLVQSDFVEYLNEKLGEEGKEFVVMFDTIAYVVARDADLDIRLFSRVFQSEKLVTKLFKLIDFNKSGELSVERVIVFIMDLSLLRHQSPHKIRFESIDEIFSKSVVGDRTSELSLDDFKKLIPCKDAFFAERVFRILDKDGSNGISSSELRQGLEQVCSQTVEDKVRFLFRIYDRDGDGLIQLNEVRAVLKACTEENEMNFSEEQLDQLALALYEDAVDSVDSMSHSACNGLEYGHLKAQLDKHPGLVDELSFSLERFLLPNSPRMKRKRRSPMFSWSYLRNNASFYIFFAGYLFVNLALLVSRAMDYKDENCLYMCARAFGQALNFNCALVIALMLRSCITWLRQTRLAVTLPLDQHVYLHKLCGTVIALFASLHSLLHFLNFPINVANQVVSPVTNQTHSAEEWLFTMSPGMYGLIPGIANLTGWGLLIILCVMIPCSLPSVRKTGYFELFYWTHLLHFLFWVLMILHGPHFWYWIVGPGTLFILQEKFLRLRRCQTGEGKTFINYAVLLPSRVTHLVCRKPSNFDFHPGDYVYVNIPAIASFEWHPFTISSAPELPDVLWLHIRGVGGWTNKLHEFFKSEQIIQQSGPMEDLISPLPTESQHLNQPTADKNNLIFEEPTHQEIPSTKRRNYSHQLSIPMSEVSLAESLSGTQSVTHTGYRYMRRPPDVINLPVPSEQFDNMNQQNRKWEKKPNQTVRSPFVSEAIETFSNPANNVTIEASEMPIEEETKKSAIEGVHIYHPLEITIDGPYGAPSSHIFRAEHAVLIAAGIGVTPFASILQSIMHRYYASRHTCPRCEHSWAIKMPDSIMNLKKVDFFWINRDQRSFEWFVHMLSQLEMEQAEMDGALSRFLDLHMYITSALKKTDMKAVGLQMALDLLHAKEKRDLVTGLKTRTNAGRPNWDKVFQKLANEDKGRVTVFYCGPPKLAKELNKKCNFFGFEFRKEIF